MDFYKTPNRGWRILDNGEAEGDQIGPGSLIDLARSLEANEIVVPDTLGDFSETLEKAQWFKHMIPHDEGFKYMGVVQGTNLTEWTALWNFYMHEDWINTIALPRIMNTSYNQCRFEFAEKVQEWNSKPIHCLGASKWVKEVAHLAKLQTIRSMDTSLPTSMGLAYKDIEDYSYEPRQENFFDMHPTSGQMEVILRNARIFCQWAAEETSDS